MESDPDIAAHYAQGMERARLSTSSRLEGERTWELLQRFLPEPAAVVLDVGGAEGAYALPPARAGYTVHLLDPAPEHMHAARAASREQPSVPLVSVEVGDARALPAEDGTVDVVLLLGPLYHLPEADQRGLALAEARRVLRAGGVVLAAGISRFASTFDGVRTGAITDPTFEAMVQADLNTGVHRNPDVAGRPEWFTLAYFYTPDELRRDIEQAGFLGTDVLAVEGPGATADLHARLDEPCARSGAARDRPRRARTQPPRRQPPPSRGGHTPMTIQHTQWVRTTHQGQVQIGYRMGGAGAHTVVFLHGLAGHAGEWDRTAAALQPECTTIALDQRGHGTSTRVPPDTSREAFVADVTAVIEHAACPQPVTLVGQSMGAHTALLTAAWRPDMVARLVVVEGDVGGGGVVAARNVHHALAAWPDHFDTYEQARDFFGGDTERGRAWAQGYEHHPGGWWPRFDRQVMDAVMSPVLHEEWWHAWTSVRATTLLVLAQHSSIDTTRIDRMCQLRPATQRVTIPQAGHDLHLEQPEAWITTLQQFLATAPTPASR